MKIVYPITITEDELKKNNSKQLENLIKMKLEFAQCSLQDKLEELGYLPEIDYNNSGIYRVMGFKD